MTLTNAVEMGRFCGLNTVEECISNVERHSISIFKYTELQKELEELHEDYDLYLDGHYKLDIEAIDRKNKEEMDRWIAEEDEYHRTHPNEEVEDFDFN